MSWYELLLFVHVANAVIWVGGALVVQLLGVMVLRSGDAHRLAGFAHDAGVLGERLFSAASALIVLTGVGLMIEGPWKWSQLWVVFALIAFAASFAVGIAILGPTAKKIGATVAAEGAESPTAQMLIRRIFLLSRIELVVLFAIVFAMTVKPTADDAATVVVVAAVIVAAWAAIIARSRSGGAEPAGVAER